MSKSLMRAIALAVLTAGAAQAQWLSTTLYLGVGLEPGALVYDSVSNKVYCANYNSDSVTVVDGANSVNRKVMLSR
jgi:DNA-binding beta-propeller fold protein YncE